MVQRQRSCRGRRCLINRVICSSENMRAKMLLLVEMVERLLMEMVGLLVVVVVLLLLLLLLDLKHMRRLVEVVHLLVCRPRVVSPKFGTSILKPNLSSGVEATRLVSK